MFHSILILLLQVTVKLNDNNYFTLANFANRGILSELQNRTKLYAFLSFSVPILEKMCIEKIGPFVWDSSGFCLKNVRVNIYLISLINGMVWCGITILLLYFRQWKNYEVLINTLKISFQTWFLEKDHILFCNVLSYIYRNICSLEVSRQEKVTQSQDLKLECAEATI